MKADLITKNLPLTGGMTKEARREIRKRNELVFDYKLREQ